MFANIGRAFIDMATQMIAKALVMKALGILTGGGGGGTMSNGTSFNWTSQMQGPLGPWANRGLVTPQAAMSPAQPML